MVNSWTPRGGKENGEVGGAPSVMKAVNAVEIAGNSKICRDLYGGRREGKARRHTV